MACEPAGWAFGSESACQDGEGGLNSRSMSEEDFTYFQQLAQEAIMSGDANMDRYAQSLQRHLKKRIGLVSGKRIGEVDQMILNESRQIE